MTNPDNAITVTCKACGNRFTNKYCNRCGEKVYTDKDKRVSHFFEEGLHFVTHFEGTLFNTLKAVFGRPGQLSLDYCNGIRKKYFKPLPLYLLLILVYLLFPTFEGLNQQFRHHLTAFGYGDYAVQKTKALLATGAFTEEGLAAAFNQKSERVSKFMLLVLLPLTALFLWAVAFRKRRYFFDHMVFSIETNSVYLIWGYLLLPLMVKLYLYAGQAFTSQPLDVPDPALGVIAYLFIGTYVFRGLRRFYGYKAWQALLITLLFAVAHEATVHLVYKPLLFETVMRFIA